MSAVDREGQTIGHLAVRQQVPLVLDKVAELRYVSGLDQPHGFVLVCTSVDACLFDLFCHHSSARYVGINVAAYSHLTVSFVT